MQTQTVRQAGIQREACIQPDKDRCRHLDTDKHTQTNTDTEGRRAEPYNPRPTGQTDRQRHIQAKRETASGRHIETHTYRQTERSRNTDRERHATGHTHAQGKEEAKQRQTDSDGKTHIYRDIYIHNTNILRDRDRERHRRVEHTARDRQTHTDADT